MSILFVFIKIFPVFGLSFGVLLLDLMKTMKRRGNKVWVGCLIFAILFFIATLLWLGFRGDKNADRWFYETQMWMQS